MLKTIFDNCGEPSKVSSSFSPSASGYLSSDEEPYLDRMWEGDYQFVGDTGVRRAFFSGRSSAVCHIDGQCSLEDAAKGLDANTLCNQIVEHVTRGLDKHGFYQVGPGWWLYGSEVAGSRGVWAADGNELAIFLDVEVDVPGDNAIVDVWLIDSQTVGLW